MKRFGRFSFYKNASIAMIMKPDLTNHPIKAVLFDMDGVLVDSIPIHIQSWNEVLLQKGLPEYSTDLYFSALGRTSLDMVRTYCRENQIMLTESQMQDILSQKEDIFQKNIGEYASTTPGVIDWLDYCKCLGILCAVVSSSTMTNIIHVLHSLHIADFFSAIVSGANFPASKPDPRVYQNAAASLGMPAQFCLVVEDTPTGIQAAKHAGMVCCAVTTSYPKHFLENADLVLNFLSDADPKILFLNERRKK
ncbi:MAG TPA: HAD family phosphatase [Anaerolineaceae bacterium]|nr:HAD family phosphatase [Anaerolineaceae bacterium]